jgi:hypothetical protein
LTQEFCVALFMIYGCHTTWPTTYMWWVWIPFHFTTCAGL